MISILFNKYKTIFYILLIPYLCLIFIFSYPINRYDVTLPGGMVKVERDIVIEGDVSSNDFYTTYVISPKTITPFQLFLAKIDHTISTEKRVQKDLNYTFMMGQIHEELSYQYAIINAYKLAGEINPNISIDYHLQGYQLLYSLNKNGQSGDIITMLDGYHITSMSTQDVNTYFEEHENITVTYLRDGKTLEAVYLKEDGKFGIRFYPYYQIEKTIPTYKKYYHQDLVGGPSGGLIQMLKIYSSLLNLDYQGIKIGGTGTIDEFGNVGAIGGIKQKIYTAQKKVDIFFVPEANYDEALEAYQTIYKPTFQLVKVSTVHEAITRLSTYTKD